MNRAEAPSSIMTRPMLTACDIDEEDEQLLRDAGYLPVLRWVRLNAHGVLGAAVKTAQALRDAKRRKKKRRKRS
jgi:hypothetical protein